MVIGMSALAEHGIDGVINIYSEFYNNFFLIWGKYRKGLSAFHFGCPFNFIIRSKTALSNHDRSERA